MHKRFDGNDEEVIDPDLPILDSHHHLFDRPGTRYLLEDYAADAARGHNVRASVYVEILAMARRDGPEHLRPLGEIEFANGVGAMAASGQFGPCRVAAAIVGFADLRLGDRVTELLERSLAAAPERFRGIRQLTMEHPDPAVWRFVTNPPPSGVLGSTEFADGLRRLSDLGLTFDAAVFHHQLPDLAHVAAAHPDLTIVLNHLGQAMGLDMDADQRASVFEEWRTNLALLAREPNVVCKIGGLGLPFWGFGFQDRPDVLGSPELAQVWGPYVETAIELFGPERCMMESNFPMDGRSTGFVPLWNALKRIVRNYSAAEKRDLFWSTAAKTYRIDIEPA